MKLLVLIHRLPCPADRGGKLRAAIEVKYLAARHEVWCAGFLDAPVTGVGGQAARASLAELRRTCRDVLAVPLRRSVAGMKALGRLAAGGTCTEGFFDSTTLERGVMKWSSEVSFDAVLAFSSSMAPLALRVPGKRHVLDLVDLDSRKWAQAVEQSSWPMRWVYRAEAERLGMREREWIDGFDASVLVNEREADLLSDASLRRRVHVIETGASTDFGASGAEPSEGECMRMRRATEPIVGFLGAMDYGPNIDGAMWFRQEMWPRIQARQPDARWWIVGRSPSRAIRQLDDGESIRVTGTVPAVEPYLAHMRVNVAPLRLARGVQTKVLTAMAAGVACVVTSCVAEGVGAEAGKEILVSDSPTGFADAVSFLLEDRDEADRIGAAGRSFVARRYRPATSLARLEALLAGDREGVCDYETARGTA